MRKRKLKSKLLLLLFLLVSLVVAVVAIGNIKNTFIQPKACVGADKGSIECKNEDRERAQQNRDKRMPNGQYNGRTGGPVPIITPTSKPTTPTPTPTNIGTNSRSRCIEQIQFGGSSWAEAFLKCLF
jgi:hypothetical protein